MVVHKTKIVVHKTKIVVHKTGFPAQKNSSNGPSDLSGKTLANLVNSQCNWLLFLVIPFQPREKGLKKWWNKQSCSIGCSKSSKDTKLAFIPGLEYDQHDWQMARIPSFRGSA